MDERPRLLSSQRTFEGRVFNVRVDRLAYDDGSEHRIDVVEHGPSFAILATPDPGRLILVRQYRHAVEAALWELPAGTAHPGEDPLAGAARELAEETGYRAARLERVASLYVTPGFCDEVMHFVRASELTPGEQALDEDERIEVAIFTYDAAWRLVARGEIADMKTVLALHWVESNRGELTTAFGR
jgi:ADP-ribose pyrophosphatase